MISQHQQSNPDNTASIVLRKFYPTEIPGHTMFTVCGRGEWKHTLEKFRFYADDVKEARGFVLREAREYRRCSSYPDEFDVEKYAQIAGALEALAHRVFPAVQRRT